MAKSNSFHGSFIFIPQGYGILSSIYQNTDVTIPYPEIAKLIDTDIETGVGETKDEFAGQYNTVWLEAPNNDPVKAKLVIRKKSDNTYSLHWDNLDPKNIRTYEGIGMIQDGKLIGCYW